LVIRARSNPFCLAGYIDGHTQSTGGKLEAYYGRHWRRRDGIFRLWVGHLGHELEPFNLRVGAKGNQCHTGSVDWQPFAGRAVWEAPHICSIPCCNWCVYAANQPCWINVILPQSHVHECNHLLRFCSKRLIEAKSFSQLSLNRHHNPIRPKAFRLHLHSGMSREQNF